MSNTSAPPALTESQTKAFARLQEFVRSTTPVFMLQGYAGTGKTFLVKHLVEWLNYSGFSVRLMAPTGRAAMIIAEKTKREARTIHKAIFDFDSMQEDGSTFKVHYKLQENVDPAKTIYIVDESSMISDGYMDNEFFRFGSGHLLKDLFRYVNSERMPGHKVVFVGDRAQLPPINTEVSPALSPGYLKSTYQLDSAGYELNQVVRQEEDSGILKTATMLREALAAEEFDHFKLGRHYEDVEVIGLDNALPRYLEATDGKPGTSSIVITHSNREALDYNRAIRGNLFPHREEPQPNDVLIITRNNYNYPVDLYNGQFVRVVEVDEVVETKEVGFIKRGNQRARVTLKFRQVLLEVQVPDAPDQQIRCNIIDSFLTSPKGHLSQDEQQGLYIDFRNRHRHLPEDSIQYQNALQTDKYFNALQVKYGYAITCHKAQGGEWRTAFVSGNVTMRLRSPDFFRWMYTAVTRASEKLVAIQPREHSPLMAYIIKSIKVPEAVPPRHRFVFPGFYEQETDAFPAEFLKARYLELQHKLQELDVLINVEHRDDCERYYFSALDERVVMDCQYTPSGFYPMPHVVETSSEAFADEVWMAWHAPLYFEPVFAAESTAQKSMYFFLLDATSTLDLRITNIEHLEWHDRYYIETEAACAWLDCWYKASGVFSTISPHSTDGLADEQLRALLRALHHGEV